MTFSIIGGEAPLSWDEFEKLAQIDIKNKKLAREETSLYVSDWVYRGQASSSWGLDSTFERYLQREFGIKENQFSATRFYYLLSSICAPISSLTNEEFESFDPLSLNLNRHHSLPKIKLLTFARHHGFPAPILDWSKSFFVAAFFAYQNANDNEEVAIYASQEITGQISFNEAEEPIWYEVGPYIDTHPRHYAQQSVYTCCPVLDKNGDMFFVNHEHAAAKHSDAFHLKKFILKKGQRRDVLERLNMMNINAYTLFQSIDSLMESLAYKEIVIKGNYTSR